MDYLELFKKALADDPRWSNLQIEVISDDVESGGVGFSAFLGTEEYLIGAYTLEYTEEELIGQLRRAFGRVE